ADGLGQPRLHEAVDVLGVNLEAGRLRLDLLGEALEGGIEPARLLGLDRGAAPERPHVGARRGDLLGDEPPIGGKGTVELPELLVRVRRVVPPPELHESRPFNAEDAEEQGGRGEGTYELTTRRMPFLRLDTLKLIKSPTGRSAKRR